MITWTHLEIRALPGDRWELATDWYVDLRQEIRDFRGVIWIPKDFRYDLASVPPFLRGTWLGSRVDSEHGATLHDYAIKHRHLRVIQTSKTIVGGQIELTPQHHYTVEKVSRRMADHIFRRMLRAAGIPRVKRWAMWAAVRAVSIRKVGFFG